MHQLDGKALNFRQSIHSSLSSYLRLHSRNSISCLRLLSSVEVICNELIFGVGEKCFSARIFRRQYNRAFIALWVWLCVVDMHAPVYVVDDAMTSTDSITLSPFFRGQTSHVTSFVTLDPNNTYANIAVIY